MNVRSSIRQGGVLSLLLFDIYGTSVPLFPLWRMPTIAFTLTVCFVVVLCMSVISCCSQYLLFIFRKRLKY